MNGNDKTIEFFDVEPSELYDTIDKKLRGAGGTDKFKMLSMGTKVYAYDFPGINKDSSYVGTVMVFIPPQMEMTPNGNDRTYMNTKTYSGTILLLGFEQNENYKGLLDALMELKNSRQ